MPASDRPTIDIETRRKQLITLQKNLNILLEREAKYGGNVPLELLNQIDDHRQAIKLIEQALNGDVSADELEEAIKPLLLAFHNGQVIKIVNYDIRWLPVVIALVAVIGLMAYLYLQLRPDPLPTRMQKQFNVAVAEFLVQDEKGQPVQSDDGLDMGKYLYDQIQTNFEELELQKVVSWEVWDPEKTGFIAGQTRAEREQVAAVRAAEINAHVLIYGVITDQGADSRVEPEFFVNHTSFSEAEEISGQHQLGRAIAVTLPFTEQIQAVENPALASRSNALSLITLGLAYYSIDDFNKAIVRFQQAADDPHWLDNAGKEIIHLLLGNAYVRQASKEQSPAYLPQASAEYDQALAINSNYGRAKVGLAGVKYLLALGDPTQLTPGRAIVIDPAKLNDIDNLLDEIARLPDQPESANIETKVHFQRGMLALARYRAKQPGGNWLTTAQTEFSEVTRHYEDGDSGVKALASHAYAQLGGIAKVQGHLDLAIELLQKAVQTASPFYVGKYNSSLASFYLENDQVDLACEALEKAIAIAERRGDQDSIKRYTDKLNSLADCQQPDDPVQEKIP